MNKALKWISLILALAALLLMVEVIRLAFVEYLHRNDLCSDGSICSSYDMYLTLRVVGKWLLIFGSLDILLWLSYFYFRSKSQPETRKVDSQPLPR